MGRATQAMFACALLGCGARTDLGKSETNDASVTCAVPSFPSCDAGPAPFDACTPLHFSSGLAANCALARSECGPMDVVGVSKPACPLGGTDPCLLPKESVVPVFMANRFGSGHIAAICDITGLNALVPELQLVEYLGRSKDARVATLGTYPCNAALLPGTYLGVGLPASYVGAPAKLASDFDVVLICGSATDFTDHTDYGPIDVAWAPTFVSFVRDFGKGVLVGADYTRNCASPADVFAPLDAITEGAGIRFVSIDLSGGITIDSACVPDWPQ